MTTVADKFDARLVQDACNEAGIQARTASKAFYDRHGDRDACGFAWSTSGAYGPTAAWARPCRPLASARATMVASNCGTPAVPLPKASQSWKQALKPTPRSSQTSWASRPTQVAD